MDSCLQKRAQSNDSIQIDYRKSSLIRLLFRFYESNSGNILIGGQKIKDVDLDSLRQEIAIVPQVNFKIIHSIVDRQIFQ